MKYDNLGQFDNIDAFVEDKIKKAESSDKDFPSLFSLMFSERENVMYEKSAGFSVVKTTYGEAYDEVVARSRALARIVGAPRDSVVGLYMDNGPEWIISFWSVLRAGYKPLLMNSRLSKSVLEDALLRLSAVAVVSDGEIFSVKTVPFSALCPGDDTEPDGFGTEFFVMSSGTSESVKLCAYSARQMFALVKDSYYIVKRCKLIKEHCDGQLKLLTFLPFYHVFGLIAVYIWFGFFSRTFVALSDLAPETIVSTVKRHRVTHIFAVPLFWENIYDKAMKAISRKGLEKRFLKGVKIANALDVLPPLGRAFRRKAFAEVRENIFGDSVRFLISGGSAISGEVLSFFNAIGYRLADGYGMSEIGITSVELSSSKKALCAGSVGKPLPSAGYSVSAGGELLVRGEAVCSYVVCGDFVSRYDGGWFKTGDLAEKRGGRYYILGRKDDLVVGASGENVNPVIAERAFGFLGVHGACVVSDENGKCTLIVHLNGCISQKNFDGTDRRVKAAMSENGLFGQIERIVYTSSPLIADGEIKPNRKRLARALSAGELAPVVPFGKSGEESESELAPKVRSIFAEALGKDEQEIGYTSDFFTDEGGTSLDYLAMTAAVEREFDVGFPADGNGSHTVKGVCEYLEDVL